MPASNSEPTRLMCAGVVKDYLFRERVLAQLKDRYSAVAPEIGVDVRLVAEVSKYMDRRDRNHYKLLAILLALGIVTLPLGGPILFIFITAAITFYRTYHEEKGILLHFTRGKFDAEYVRSHLTVPLTDKEAEALPQPDQNLVVYGGFLPFVGAGIDLDGWSFAIDISQCADDKALITRFSVLDLYQALDATTYSMQLPNCLTREMFYMHGSDMQHNRALLPDIYGHPKQTLTPELMQRYTESSDFSIRHYKWITVRDWNDDLVISSFLRCSIRGRNLFVEMNRFLLTPIKEQFREIDALPERDLRGNLRLAASSLVTGPLSAIAAVLVLMRRSPSLERQQQEEIRTNPYYNYGVLDSVREASMSRNFTRYFQKLDHQMYIKIFDREILDSIVLFLEDHGVDTSEFKQNQAMIVNNGIIVKGGNLQAESVAAGSNPTATVTKRISNILSGSKEKAQ